MSDPRKFIAISKRLSLTYKTIGFSDAVPQDDVLETEGIRFFADRPMQLGTKLDILLRLPNRREPIQFTGEVVWAQEGQGPDGSEVLVQFSRIDPKDLDFLLQYGLLYGP